MTKTPKLPANNVYEKGMNIGTTECMVEVNGDVWNGIDWDQPLDTPPDIRAVTTTAATQFHYANMSHLILCGRIIKQEVKHITSDTTKLAVCLAAHKADGTDIWGRYLEKSGAGATLSRPMMSYYRHLFSENDAVSILLPMETLGGPVAYTLYRELQDVGDPVFRQIAQNLATRKQAEIQCVVDYLSPMIQAFPPEQKQQVLREAKQYDTAIDTVINTFAPQFDTVNLDPGAIRNQIQENVQQFYTDLALRQ